MAEAFHKCQVVKAVHLLSATRLQTPGQSAIIAKKRDRMTTSHQSRHSKATEQPLRNPRIRPCLESQIELKLELDLLVT
eukprot:scaffold688_cov138-Skeletonema_dohrnii-CCMP3373.AAC.2